MLSLKCLTTQDKIIMNSAPPLGHGQGQHINRPPLFNGEYYSWWKTRMEDFIQAEIANYGLELLMDH